MKKLLLILLCLPLIGFGQNFIKEYNQNILFGIGSSVIQTSDNGYILSSSIRQSNNDSSEFGLYKIDMDGNLQWDRISGGIYGNYSADQESVFQLSDGSFISLSKESPAIESPLSKIRLIKRDVNGNSLWEKNYNADSCGITPFNFAKTNDGGYIIYASTNGSLTNNIDYIYLIKTDNMGVIMWTKLYNNLQLSFSNGGGSGGSAAIGTPRFGVKQTIDGGYIISGINNVFLQGMQQVQPSIAKLNQQGDIDWIQSYSLVPFNTAPLSGWFFSNSVEQTSDDGYILSGKTYESLMGNGTSCVIKTDNGGNLEWSILDSTGIIDIKQTNDGGYIYLSNKILDTISYNREIVLNKIDALGNDLWNKSFSNCFDGFCWANSNIEQTSDGGYVLCGSSVDTITEFYSILLIKTDGNGDITSTYNIPVNSNKGELLRVTDLLGRETKGTKNEVLFYIYDDGTVEKRIVIE